jgi:hypothetical protein
MPSLDTILEFLPILLLTGVVLDKVLNKIYLLPQPTRSFTICPFNSSLATEVIFSHFPFILFNSLIIPYSFLPQDSWMCCFSFKMVFSHNLLAQSSLRLLIPSWMSSLSGGLLWLPGQSILIYIYSTAYLLSASYYLNKGKTFLCLHCWALTGLYWAWYQILGSSNEHIDAIQLSGNSHLNERWAVNM